MTGKIETGIIGFDQRIQYTVKRLPYKDCECDEEAGIREYKNFVWFYAVIRVRIKNFIDEAKKTEIAERLERTLGQVRRLGELGLMMLSIDDMAIRGAQLAQAKGDKAMALSSAVEKELAAQVFEADFCRNETRALAFLRAFEGMIELFDKSIDDEAFLWALEAQYPPLERKT